MYMRAFTLLLASVLLALVMPVSAVYFDFNTNGTLHPGDNISVYGNTFMNNGSYTNNSEMHFTFMNYTGSWVNVSDNATGHFSWNLTVPHNFSHGIYNLSIFTGTINKTVSIFITNASYGNIRFLTKLPPYDANNTFLINVSLYDESNSLLANYMPTIEIFKTNSQRESWTIRNTTNAAVHNGNITYNVTVPSNADGTYIIDVDRGAVQQPIFVRSGYMLAVETQTGLNETRSDFYPGANFSIIAKIRSLTGDPVSGAANVTARITMPNGTVQNITLSYDSSRPGYYTGIYFTNDSLNNTGSYGVRVDADIGNSDATSAFSFNTKAIKVTLEKQEEFFKEWGGSAAFAAGQPAGMNVVVTNLNNDTIYPGTIAQSTFEAGGYVNCTANGTIALKLENVINGSTVSLPAITYDAGGIKFGNNVCRILFTAPSATGLYRITVNSTVNVVSRNITETGVGYFSVQNYVLKATPKSGEGDEFMVMIYPGENLTFELSAYDLRSQEEISGTNITNITTVSLTPVEFLSGAQAITNITITNVTLGTIPSITITTPENTTGPMILKVQAIIRNWTSLINETVTGETFFVAKYIMGFLSPMAGSQQGMQGGPGGGGGGGGMGGPMSGGVSACSGTINFTGSVFDVKAGMASGSGASGVVISNIIEARQEMSGTSIKSCLTLTGGSSTSSGSINVSLAFSNSCTYSDFYFIILNATYQSKQDMLPMGFMCKSLSFTPQTIGADGNMQWRFDPSKPVNISVSSIIRASDGVTIGNGTLRFVRAMSYVPGSGPRYIAATAGVSNNFTYLNTSDPARLTIYPQNISKDVWPNGFLELVFEVCPNTATYGAGGCDTAQTGLNVIAYDMQIWDAPWGQTVAAGGNVSLKVAVATNVSRSCSQSDQNYNCQGQNWTTSGFSIKVGRPYEGNMITISSVNATLISDGWNHAANSRDSWNAFETWNVSFTIPSSVKKGENSISIETNSSRNEKASQDIWLTISKYNIRAPNVEQTFIYGATQYNTSILADNVTLNLSNGINMNMDNITKSTGVSSKSGVVCYKTLLGNSYFSYANISRPWQFIIVDSTTAGVYDTIIIDNLGNWSGLKPYIVLNYTNRNVTDFYLWTVDSCSSIRGFNATSLLGSSAGGYNYGSSSWLGSYAKSMNVTIPYIVSYATNNSALNGATMEIGSIVKQYDSSGSNVGGGFGMEKRITNLDTSRPVTDNRGVAFTTINLSSAGSGSYGLFWKMTAGSEITKSDWTTVSQLMMRNFDLYGNMNNSNTWVSSTGSDVYQNKTFVVCAKTFGSQPAAIAGAAVVLSASRYPMTPQAGPAGPTVTNITMFMPDSKNGTIVANATTDATGCVSIQGIFNLASGWPRGNTEISALADYNGGQETTRIGQVYRDCGGPCTGD